MNGKIIELAGECFENEKSRVTKNKIPKVT